MYKHNLKQMEFENFNLPFDGRLRSDNRWVKLAKFIPWEEFEVAYAKNLSGSGLGPPAMSVRIALGALIIKEKLGLIVLYVVYRVLKGVLNDKTLRDDEITFRVEVSGPGDYSSHYDRADRPKGPPAKWYPYNQGVNVKNHDIPGGLLYVGTNLPDNHGYKNDACLINPKLPIKPTEPWEAGDDMGYWPKYGNIPAKCRGAYLKWLSGGGTEPEAYFGYVFLFFMGLSVAF